MVIYNERKISLKPKNVTVRGEERDVKGEARLPMPRLCRYRGCPATNVFTTVNEARIYLAIRIHHDVPRQV